MNTMDNDEMKRKKREEDTNRENVDSGNTGTGGNSEKVNDEDEM